MNVPLSHYFNKHPKLALPFVYIPYFQGKQVSIIENNKYYKYIINMGNHYHMRDNILSDKDNWQDSDQFELINSSLLMIMKKE